MVNCHLDSSEDDALVVVLVCERVALSQRVERLAPVSDEHLVEATHQLVLLVALRARRLVHIDITEMTTALYNL